MECFCFSTSHWGNWNREPAGGHGCTKWLMYQMDGMNCGTSASVRRAFSSPPGESVKNQEVDWEDSDRGQTGTWISCLAYVGKLSVRMSSSVSHSLSTSNSLSEDQTKVVIRGSGLCIINVKTCPSVLIISSERLLWWASHVSFLKFSSAFQTGFSGCFHKLVFYLDPSHWWLVPAVHSSIFIPPAVERVSGF